MALVSRRRFLSSSLVVGAAALLGPSFAPRRALATTTGSGGLYAPNGGGLAASAFLRLPPGAVRPQGWLSTQLSNQLTGLNGQMTYVSHFLQPGTCGWITPSQYGWEEAPYWLRGYANLGYVTGDATTINVTEQWMTGTIQTQQPNGFFGPENVLTSLNGGFDPWPYMPMLRAITSYQEYTGDSSVVPFLQRFFSYLTAQPTSQISNGWGYPRWAEMMDSIIWLYNRTGDSSLLSLMTTIHNNSADWMTSSLPTLHNVNISEGFREPAVYSQLGGASYVQGTYNSYAQVMGTWGQVAGGGFGGDENCRPGYADPRQGFETCGIVELMQSCEILAQVLGDPIWADRCEQLAFNMLPAALDPAQQGTHYITGHNSIQLDNVPKTMGQFDNGFAMQAYMPGVDQYRCCPHNYGMGWPMFTQSLWLATGDDGLCANMYAPCTVTAEVASSSTTITFTEATDYPFSGAVTLKLASPGSLTFPLYVRVPGWCPSPAIQVNGQTVSSSAGPSYVKISRTWASGDTVTLSFSLQPAVTSWPTQEGAVTVSYGALQFSTQIDENWNQFATTPTLNNGSMTWPEYEVAPGSPWNYGLVLDSADPASSLTVDSYSGSLPANPFTQPAPVSMTVAAQQIADWHSDCMNVVTPLQDGPVASGLPQQTISLIPMGAARLRISSLPVIGSAGSWLAAGGAAFRIQNQNSGLVLGVTGMSTADGADVVQFADSGTTDHLWQLIDNGDGWFRIRNDNSGKVLAVSDMSTADSAQVTQFDDNGTTDHLWRLIPDGNVKVQNANSGLLCGVAGMSTADSANVVQYHDSGTSDHLWQFIPDSNGYLRIKNLNSAKVMGVAGMSAADSANIVQYDDNGSADHLWRLRYTGNTLFRLQNSNSDLVMGVSDMSQADGAQVVQYDDNATADHNWQFLAANAFDS